MDNTEAQLRKYRSVIYSSVAALILLSLIAVFIYFLYYKNKRLRNVLENREAELIEAKGEGRGVRPAQECVSGQYEP